MKNNFIGKTKPIKTKEKKERRFIFNQLPETGEMEIQKQATETQPAKTVRFPKEQSELYKLPPDEFANVQNALEAAQSEDREIVIYANSIESRIGYDSLIRVLGNHFGRQMAYFRSEKGGSLSLEEARKRAYERKYDELEAKELLSKLLTVPTDKIDYEDLRELHENSAAMAENLWELIKREAKREFESGHRAAAVFEPTDEMKDAWNRASYLGLRESLCAEWQPKGGIELSMIDAIAQAWLQLQFWTEKCVERSKTESRKEDYDFQKWKKWNREIDAETKQWNGNWDVPFVREQEAIEHAAQMADRWQRMYFRAVRNLRDWRRYTPQVTINNPNQVNIAADGGQQINVSNGKTKK
ncbi:MAG: hypothetical protein M3Q99_19070 [Acidobacteriota bacterium]|nr:hypothetical protein [Acidobacteriota bacterium]